MTGSKRKYSMSTNDKVGPGQLPLAIESREKSIGMQCRGIFSSLYLRNNFTKSEDFPFEAEVRPVYEEMQALWFTVNGAIYKRNEAFTREKFILPLFEALGWLHLPEEHMPKQLSGLRKRPDYCVFSDPDAYQRASESQDTMALFRISDRCRSQEGGTLPRRRQADWVAATVPQPTGAGISPARGGQRRQ